MKIIECSMVRTPEEAKDRFLFDVLKSYGDDRICSDEYLHLIEEIEECDKPPEEDFFQSVFRSRQTEAIEIRDVDSVYSYKLGQFSRKFETWSISRRRLISDLKKKVENLENVVKYAEQGKLISSSLSVIGTTGSLLLKNNQSQWTTATFLGAVDCIGILSSLVEISSTKHVFDDIKQRFAEDEKNSQQMMEFFQSMDSLDRAVEEIFPYGIDTSIVRDIMIHGDAHLGDYSLKGIVEDFASGKSNKKEKNSNLRKRISLAVLLSNAQKNPKILEDKNFLAMVKMFSKSSLAKNWWNRMKAIEILNRLKNRDTVYKIEYELKRNVHSVHDFYPLSVVLPTPFMSAATRLILSGLAAFNAYSELTNPDSSKAVEILRKVTNYLQKDYDELTKAYDDLLAPRYD